MGGNIVSLIKCPECEREISDKAKYCPSCGYPMNSKQLSDKNDEKSRENVRTLLILCCAAIFLIVVLSIYYFNRDDSKKAQKRLQDSVEQLEKKHKEVESIEKELEENQRQIDWYKSGK